jgi:hypothetical protein
VIVKRSKKIVKAFLRRAQKNNKNEPEKLGTGETAKETLNLISKN